MHLNRGEDESMVIGWPHREQHGATAWARIEGTQRDVALPCLLVPQPAHAVLAGEVATALVPTAFGELPSEVVRAIQMHDTGWAASDAQQIQRLRSPGAQAMAPVSFVAVSAAEAIEAWTASIDTVESMSRVGAIMVSRHFTLLAAQDRAHQRFIQAETARQRRLEGAALANGEKHREADLDRWTAALGFCDLLSLYLLSGLNAEVEFPLAHPASPHAKTARRVRLQMENRNLRFTPETLRAGDALSIHALKHPLPAQGPRAETLSWEVQ